MSVSPKPSNDGPGRPSRESAEAFIEAARLAAAEREAAYAALKRGRMGGDPPSTDDREKLIHNEQCKLTAALLNGLALAFLVAGIVTTATGAGSLPDPADQLMRALVWIVVGIVLHIVGRLILGSLR